MAKGAFTGQIPIIFLTSALTLAATLIGTAYTEHLRRPDEPVRQEVAKAQFENIAEAWRSLNVYEGAVVRASSTARTNAARPDWLVSHIPPRNREEEFAEITRLLASADSAESAFWDILARNRFYIDASQRSALLEHYRWVRYIHITENSELLQEREAYLVWRRTGYRSERTDLHFVTDALDHAMEELTRTRHGVRDVQDAVLVE